MFLLNSRYRAFLAAGFCAVLLAACQPSDQDVEAQADIDNPPIIEPSAAWISFIDEQIEAYLSAHPAWAVVQGRHEFDGQLPDWSADTIQAEIARLRAGRETAKEFTADELGPQGEFQRDYFIATMDRALFWLDKAEWPFVNPAFYFDWMTDSLDPSPYITLTYAPLQQRMQAFTRYASNIPRAAAQIRANLRMPMSRTRLEYGISSFGGLADYFANDVPAVFAEVADEKLQSEFAAANAAAATAMQELADWLQANLATANEDYAIGPELFSQMVYDTERVSASLAELEAMGREDMRRNQLALGEACAEFAPGESIRSCFAKMANRKPQGGAVEGAREQLKELRAFVEEQRLVTIPGPEEALVADAPPYARSNSAYINIPGPYEKNQPSVYYISPPDPTWTEEVQQAYVPGESALLFTSVHEVWPGHFLNFLHANRAHWKFGRSFVSYAFGEGWAHYSEEMMIDAGLRGDSAETRVGQLSNALLRNARFLSAIGLHTAGMSVADSEKMFIEEAYQDEGTARQQAARGTYDPGYLNYTLGKLMIRQLRNDWTADKGGREAWREFHDKFLSYGGPPIPLVRTQMMGQ